MKYSEQESVTLEFKREIPKNEQIIKSIIGFCNQKGGRLILGIENDGTIIGVEESRVQEMLEFLEKAILEASHPPIVTQIYSQRIFDKVVLVLEVSEGMNKPYFLKKDWLEKGTFIRLGRSTLRATSDLIEELKWFSRGISFDCMPVYQASESDLDIEKFEFFLSTRKSAQQSAEIKGFSTRDAMISYRVMVQDHNHYFPTVCGILLFGKNPQYFFPEARAVCNHFSGISVGNEVIASQECLGTLDNQFRMANNFIVRQLHHSWKIVGVLRTEELEIPKEAVREILMNAIIHRNYHIAGPNKIAIFDNRVEIFSQGSFPGPIGKNLKAGFTCLRNSAICKILREMGLIENFGLGFILTFAGYEKAGIKSPEIIEGENFIKCILPRKTPENMHARSGMDKDFLAILNLFDTINEVSVADLIQHLHLSRPTATRRLARLSAEGSIKKIGSGRGVRYVKNLKK